MSAAYTVSVPYQDVETYYENEPYQVQVEAPLSYSVTYSSASNDWNLSQGCHVDASVSVKNVDTSPGTFKVNFTFTTLSNTYSDIDTAYVFPAEVKTLTGLADTSCGEDYIWNYSVTPGTKMVTDTQYKQVEHQRIVTKERLETRYKKVSVLDYLLNY